MAPNSDIFLCWSLELIHLQFSQFLYPPQNSDSFETPAKRPQITEAISLDSPEVPYVRRGSSFALEEIRSAKKKLKSSSSAREEEKERHAWQLNLVGADNFKLALPTLPLFVPLDKWLVKIAFLAFWDWLRTGAIG